MTIPVYIRVGTASFCIAEEHQRLADNHQAGAVVTFTGKVRNHNSGDQVLALTLEHYPAMTERVLAEIAAQAQQQWPLLQISIIHRTGHWLPGEDIVFAGVSAAHRSDVFLAAEFIMDFVKTQVPFWKRETTRQGERWLESQDSDLLAAQCWHGTREHGDR